MTDVTIILHSIESGSARTEDLLPLVYEELRRLASAQMRHERGNHTLQPTALVHEAFLRLVRDDQPSWQNRRHFFSAAAVAMQRILVEQARRRQQLKRGGAWQQSELADEVAIDENPAVTDTDLLALDDALRQLEQQDAAKAELVRLRYFAGLNEDEAARALNISRATASRWWAFAKAWLFQRIRDDVD